MYYKGEKMDTMGGGRDTDFHGYGQSIRESLSRLIPRRENVDVLDIGTGMGVTSRFLLQHLSGGSRLWTVDPSEEVIAQARAALGGEKERRVRFVVGTADRLEFKDESFDIVVSVMVMHHIKHIDKPIAEMSRVLRPGGRLIVVDFLPEAHTLEFQSRHSREDFFTADSVSDAAKAAHLEPRAETHDKWYLVEATKPARRRAGAAGAPHVGRRIGNQPAARTRV